MPNLNELKHYSESEIIDFLQNLLETKYTPAKVLERSGSRIETFIRNNSGVVLSLEEMNREKLKIATSISENIHRGRIKNLAGLSEDITTKPVRLEDHLRSMDKVVDRAYTQIVAFMMKKKKQ